MLLDEGRKYQGYDNEWIDLYADVERCRKMAQSRYLKPSRERTINKRESERVNNIDVISRREKNNDFQKSKFPSRSRYCRSPSRSVSTESSGKSRDYSKSLSKSRSHSPSQSVRSDGTTNTTKSRNHSRSLSHLRSESPLDRFGYHSVSDSYNLNSQSHCFKDSLSLFLSSNASTASLTSPSTNIEEKLDEIWNKYKDRRDSLLSEARKSKSDSNLQYRTISPKKHDMSSTSKKKMSLAQLTSSGSQLRSRNCRSDSRSVRSVGTENSGKRSQDYSRSLSKSRSQSPSRSVISVVTTSSNKNRNRSRSLSHLRSESPIGHHSSSDSQSYCFEDNISLPSSYTASKVTFSSSFINEEHKLQKKCNKIEDQRNSLLLKARKSKSESNLQQRTTPKKQEKSSYNSPKELSLTQHSSDSQPYSRYCRSRSSRSVSTESSGSRSRDYFRSLSKTRSQSPSRSVRSVGTTSSYGKKNRFRSLSHSRSERSLDDFGHNCVSDSYNSDSQSARFEDAASISPSNSASTAAFKSSSTNNGEEKMQETSIEIVDRRNALLSERRKSKNEPNLPPRSRYCRSPSRSVRSISTT